MAEGRQPPAPGGPAQGPEDTHRVQLSKRQVVITMAGVMMAMFLAALDQTVVGTAMPGIIADLGGFDRYTWVTSSYLVASTAVVPIVGRLSDMYGRKWFFIVGIIIFLVGSVFAGLSQTMTQLIAFRALQGLGGGIIMANTFVVIGDLFPPAERGKYTGLLSGVFGLSSILGPTLGGVVTDQLSWHWIFFINIPLGIPVVLLFIAYFPNIKPSKRRHQLDYLGMATLVLTVVPLMLALSWAGVQYPWGSVQVVGTVVFSAVMLVVFLVNETRAPEPIIPLSLFRDRVTGLSFLVVFLTGFAMFGGIIFVPLYFQGVLGRSATSSGSFLTPMMLGTVAGATLAGLALSKLGGHYRRQGLVGIGILALGVFLVSRMTADTGFGVAILFLIIMGFGLGTTFPIYTIAVQNAVPYRLMGVATSTTQFFRTIGGTLGLAVLGSALTNRFALTLTRDVSQPVRDALSGETLASIARNPQALVSPEAQEQLRGLFAQTDPGGTDLLPRFLETLQGALSSAISDVFIIALVAVSLAWIATVFIREIPLRGRVSERGKGSGPRPKPEAAGDD